MEAGKAANWSRRLAETGAVFVLSRLMACRQAVKPFGGAFFGRLN